MRRGEKLPEKQFIHFFIFIEFMNCIQIVSKYFFNDLVRRISNSNPNYFGWMTFQRYDIVKIFVFCNDGIRVAFRKIPNFSIGGGL